MSKYEQIHWVNGIFEDGEWTSWDSDEIGDFFESNDNPSTLELWELLGELIESAKAYLTTTGRHLPIYGELGEFYGEVKYGIKRNKPNAPGSDGKIGDDFVEIKTISPHKSKDVVSVKRAGNFNKLLIVKITKDFKIKSKMIDRKDLQKGIGKYARASWNNSHHKQQ